MRGVREQHQVQHLLAQVLLRKFRRRLLCELLCCGRRVIVIIIVVRVRRLSQRKDREQDREKQCEQEVYCAAHEAFKCRYI